MEKLQILSPEHRQILLLRFSEDLSYDEIADILEASLGTVKSRLNRARAELRKLMEPYL
jgi:RNA polymerase sigma-70 factor (ECF subfamily)